MTSPLLTPNAHALAAADHLRLTTNVEHIDLAVTLGSGWGTSADLMGETLATVDAATVPGFRAPQVPGHGGTLRLIALPSGKTALVIAARTHLYEGHGPAAVVHSVRVAAALGATTMVLTNGAGGINPAWKPGTPVLLSDHINFTGTSPLDGAQFIDMTTTYTPALRELARTVDPTLEEGVYVQFRGPSYETPAEVRMAKALGGDIVGMSTALEAIAARSAGMEVLGMSLITNHAAGVTDQALSHQEVIDAGAAAQERLGPLLAQITAKL